MATATSRIWISSSEFIKTESNEKIQENQFNKQEKSSSGSLSLESENHHNNDSTVEIYKESLKNFLSEFKCYQNEQTTALNLHTGATHLRAMIALSKVSSAEQQALFQKIFKETFISEGGSVEVLKRFILDSTGLEANEKEFCEQQIGNLFPETPSLILEPVNKELKNDISTNEPDAPPAQPSLTEEPIHTPPVPPSLPAPPSSDGGGLLERVYTKVIGVMNSVKDSYVDVHGRVSNAQKDYSKELSEINRMEQWIDNTDKSGEKIKFKAGAYLKALEELKKRYGFTEGAEISFFDPNDNYVNVNDENNHNAPIEIWQDYDPKNSDNKGQKKVLYPTVAREVNDKLTKKDQMTNLCNDLGLSPEKSLVQVKIWNWNKNEYETGYIIVANPTDIDTLIKSVKDTFPELTEEAQKILEEKQRQSIQNIENLENIVTNLANQYDESERLIRESRLPSRGDYSYRDILLGRLERAKKNLDDAKLEHARKFKSEQEKKDEFYEIDIQKFGPFKTTGTTMTDNALGDTRQSAQKLSQAHSMAENLYKVLANACQMIAEALIGTVRNW
ncbi:hypothetical protein BJP41_04610 [Candidatus Williamhamiltonella defendens]|uniref:Uncharacterized protein n=1 Tax=Candidatus Williamhamiltonella defendens TaxID=138072 RepID=A0A2D3T1P8_9ENTR|nr:hypothetical protein [Candidatus Hamiltonella defensa]ATW29739.1 hypothetical protein BJP41_04610 [Candidatus Hamiltonella defensa]ATW31718.1 hypothetical protein BJP42_04685 [Candidatus Hamiltonella defensa]